MILIVAAKHQIDQQVLETLLARYDHAQSPAEREQVAAEIEGLVGPAVRAMLARQLGGLGLGSEDIDALKTAAVQRALRESGLTRLRRQDVVPETLLHQMQTTERGQRLWNLISPTLQQSLASSERWIRAELGQALSDELSRLLTMPDLASRLGERGDVVPSLVERTQANAEILHRLFPSAIREVASTERSLLGYIQTTILPEFKRQRLKEKAPSVTDTMRANWNIIRPYVETLRSELGRQPVPDEVNERYRADLEQRTRPAREWMEAQIARLQPNNPFKIQSAIDLKIAREIFEEAGIDPTLWKSPGAQYYISKRDVKPLGRQSVESLLGTPGLGAPSTPSAEHLLPTAPAAQQSETPDWSPLMGGGQDRLQSAIISQLFGEPQYEAEYAVAHFLAQRPDPASAEVERFLEGLSENVADDIRQIGWDAMVREVDDRIRGLLRDPGAVQEIAAEIGMSSGAAQRTADALRRTIFARCTRSLSRECAGILPRLGSSSVQLDGRGRAYLEAANRLFSPEGVEAMREVAQYVAGNPVPTTSQVDELLASLPEHVAEFIRETRWEKLSCAVDAAVIEMMSAHSN